MWHLLIKVILEKSFIEGREEFLVAHFHGDIYPQFNHQYIVEENLELSQQRIIQSFGKFIRLGSGWQSEELKYYELKTTTNVHCE